MINVLYIFPQSILAKELPVSTRVMITSFTELSTQSLLSVYIIIIIMSCR